MNSRSAHGGARDSTGWSEIEGRDADGQIVRLLATRAPATAPAEGEVRWVTLREPALRRQEGDGLPLSLTFLLDGQPEPSDDSLARRVRQGTLSAEVTVAPTQEVIASLPGGHRAVFPRSGIFSLVRDVDDECLAETEVTAGQTTAALSATVDRADALRLLDAVHGRPSGLTITAEIVYRVSSEASFERVALQCDLAEVYEVLDRGTGEDRILYRADLENYLALMLEERVVEVGDVESATEGRDISVSRVVDPFLRATSLLLTPIEDNERSDELGGRYRLGDPPPSSFNTSFTASLTGGDPNTDSLSLRIPLEELLRTATAGAETDSWLHMVASDGSGGTERLRRRDMQRGASRARNTPNTVRLAQIGDRLSSISAALRPSAGLAAPSHAVLSAHRFDRLDVGLIAEHLSFVGQSSDPPRNLPVVEDPNAALWRDRTDGSRRWYAPEFQLQAEPTAALEDSAFAFSFEARGHGLEGQPGIEAEIRFTVGQEMSQSTKDALAEEGDVRADAVPLENLSVEVSIPFRDAESGDTRAEQVRASSIEQSGDEFTALVRLRDDWARMAYGALAYEGFQTEPAKLSIAYSFRAYLPVDATRKVEVAHGTKRVEIPLEGGAARAVNGTRDAEDDSDVALSFAEGELRLGRSRPGTRSRRPLPTVSAVRPEVVHPVSAVSIRPEVVSNLTIADSDRFRDYVVGRKVREARLETLFPCGPHGGHYVEIVDGSARPIGCRETFRLGQTAHRLLERISLPEAFAACRVYRSLQTPGTFVVVPARYVITRYEADEGERAFRPTLLLYSTIDVDDLDASRCMYSCTLQPDLAPSLRAKLVDHLRLHHHTTPVLEYFTALNGDLEVEWALPTGSDGHLETEIETVRSWDGFEVTLATDALGVPQINAILGSGGISGDATLKLSDGSSLWTTLRLDLRQVAGPWSTGPLATASDGSRVTFENRIESSVAVSEVLLVGGDRSLSGSVPVERTIEPGARIEVEVGETDDERIPAYSVQSTATSLTEIRSYIEDISISLVVLNRLDFDATGVSEIRVRARLQGRSDERTVELTGDSGLTHGLEFLLPLTEYIDDPVVELTLSYRREEAWTEVAPIEWHPTRDGVMVHVTAELLGLESEE